ncbi:uncharacterized protein LOC132189863 [Corylus avellana]|uniref:uncharacterized protein LOC132189863 n=1 Tax=Corylus avellana TaxID=13451 RepID=UPI00286B99AF|nr:uncharacterized protein LOC132189863 [Corylus avellana]XP_059460663.1 uncharacterized protein LOC132189863 [Corylus avellana]
MCSTKFLRIEKQNKTMRKRGGIKKASIPGFQNSISLREESIGKKQTKGGSNNSKSMLKVEHLQKLAAWASGEAAIPSLAATFGHRLATVTEAMGVPPDPSLFSCERCETILQPGFNCTVRIEKNRAKARRKRKKTNNFTQNNMVYKCHFCSHWNLKRGTPKGHMKEICPSKAKTSSKSETAKPMLQKCASLEKSSRSKDDISKTDEIASPTFAGEIPTTDSPATPLVRSGTILLDAKRRKRNRSISKKPAGTESNSTPTDVEKAASTSNKRRKKSWTSLREIADSADHDSSPKITNLTIPFCLAGTL